VGFFLTMPRWSALYNDAMIDPHHVFVADAKPALALPAQRAAYVFGAASALGESLLNQVLANPVYTQVYVSTTAALPGSVAHLQGIMNHEPFVLQDAVAQVDVVLLVNEPGDVRPRNTVYAALLADDVPLLMRHMSAALDRCRVRYMLVSPAQPSHIACSYLASYAAHAACLVYAQADGAAGAVRQQAYRFKPQANSPLDRLGAWVLNVLSNAAHGMLNASSSAPLTHVKLSQRLMSRIDRLSSEAIGAITVVQAADLA
jgi:hypothetical protein